MSQFQEEKSQRGRPQGRESQGNESQGSKFQANQVPSYPQANQVQGKPQGLPLGHVALVGAGPGHSQYLTTQARQAIAQAEVLIYDALVDPRLLELISIHCETVDMGKRGGQRSARQEDINRLLVHYCQLGQRVVRLKSGDPFIFGRSGSESQALVDGGCSFEVIPGLSSAIAGPLFAGIPLTDPVLSRGFAIYSAHDLDALNWEALTTLETLVFLMGGRALTGIIERLIQRGKSPKTPIAIIRAAGQADQEIWSATLDTIAVQTAGIRLSPCIIVIGAVVQLRSCWGEWQNSGGHTTGDRPSTLPLPNRRSDLGDAASSDRLPPVQLTPSDSRPLAGRSILVTRAAGLAGPFTAQLTELGATALELPALAIGAPSSWEPFDEALHHLAQTDWLILTSANGVEALFQRLRHLGMDGRSLTGIKIAVVGKKTARVLEGYGIIPDFTPTNFIADALISEFPDNPAHQTILFPRVETGGRDALNQHFRQQGANLVEVAAYESRCPEIIDPTAWQALKDHHVDAITFASSKTVVNFCQLVERAIATDQPPINGKDPISALLQGICIASIGPQTSETCQNYLHRFDLEANPYTLDGLAQSLVSWFVRDGIPGI
ncbi:MAG: uroporphyrinogen-III C-methyltransferase [Cyanophyceae cyanobacterium]